MPDVKYGDTDSDAGSARARVEPQVDPHVDSEIEALLASPLCGSTSCAARAASATHASACALLQPLLKAEIAMQQSRGGASNALKAAFAAALRRRPAGELLGTLEQL